MAKSSRREDPEALAARAVARLVRKHRIKNPILVDTARDTLRATGEPIYRFRVASVDQANGPSYAVVLTASDAELDPDEIGRRDRVEYFSPIMGGPVAGAGSAPSAAVTIDPSENTFELNQSETKTETITVSIPPQSGVPKADVYFLADTTGSMGDVINAVKAGAGTILSTLNGLGLDLVYGVGNYRDFPHDPYAFQHQLNPTNVVASVSAAINVWTAQGGVDRPEGQLFALHRLAQPPGGAIGWRPGSKRIVVWFGDAPGHDPVCVAISGEPAPITEASVTARLVAEKIAVLAISTNTPGLDDDPRVGAADYTPACGAPGGAAGQATRIADATGGKFVTGINPANIVPTIVDLVKGAVSSINNVTLVAAGATVPFVTSIAPPGGYGPLAGDLSHTLTFRVTFTGVVPCKDEPQVLTGSLDVVADGTVVARKPVKITVPACPPRILYSYSVKFVCGVQAECGCACAPVRPGVYATEINIYNHNATEVRIRKRVIPVVMGGAPAGREPRTAATRAVDTLALPPHAATMDDCCRIAELLLGAPASSPLPLTVGFLEIVSLEELSVTAVYTAGNASSGSVSIDVEQIAPHVLRVTSRDASGDLEDHRGATAALPPFGGHEGHH